MTTLKELTHEFAERRQICKSAREYALNHKDSVDFGRAQRDFEVYDILVCMAAEIDRRLSELEEKK